MNDKKELLLIAHLRNNARESLTRISRKTNIPISTVFDKIKMYDGGLIKRHTTLLNFQKLGFDIKLYILFKVKRENKNDFLNFLLNHVNANSVFRINAGFDYLTEFIFKDMKKLLEFNEQLEKFGIEDRKDFFILDDIKRESFLTREMDIDNLFAKDMA